MVNTAKVSIRGQVAIPKAIREKMSINEGDTVIFEEKDGKIYIRKVKDFFGLEGSLPSIKHTTEEIKEKAMEEFAKEVIDV